MEAGPGLSLFQGSESIQLNPVTQGLEEDEEQEDKRRLDEEVTPLVSSNGGEPVGGSDARAEIVLRIYLIPPVERGILYRFV